MNLKLTRLHKYTRVVDIPIILWGIFLAITLLAKASELSYIFTLNRIEKVIQLVILTILMMKTVLIDRFSKQGLLVRMSVIFLVLLIYLITGDSFIIPISFVVASKKLDVKKFIACDMNVKLIIWILLFVLSNLKLVNNYYWIGKLSYGWSHPNTCACVIIFVMLEYIYLHWGKLKLCNYMIMAGMILFLFKYVAARTYIFAFSIILVWYFIVVRQPKRKKWKEIFYLSLLPICIIFSFVLVSQYNKGTGFGTMVNIITTGRLAFSSQFLKKYGITILGQDIVTVGSRAARILGVESQILDMAYIRLPIFYGYVTTFVFVFYYMYIIMKSYRAGKYPELMLIIYVILVGLASTVPVRFYYNITIFFIWSVVEENKEMAITS